MSSNPYGYRDGGNGLTNPIDYPQRFTARNEITGDAIRSSYRNQDRYEEGLRRIKKERLEDSTEHDYNYDKYPVISECESCGALFKGNASRGICFICNK